MPELPEVETIKRFLEQTILDSQIQRVEIFKDRLFVGDPDLIVNERIKSIYRRAKLLFISLSKSKHLMIHLKMTGQIVWMPNKQSDEKRLFGHPMPSLLVDLPSKYTHIIITLNTGILYYNDQRQFGWIKVVDDIGKETAKYGPEPFSSAFSEQYLNEIFSNTSRQIKTVLLDQRKIAGLGNIYTNDALYLANINPLRKANILSSVEIKKLRKSIIKVLTHGIKHQGSSQKNYIIPDGRRGKYQEHFKVYQQVGQKCNKCKKAEIVKIKQGGRSTFFCPQCQK